MKNSVLNNLQIKIQEKIAEFKSKQMELNFKEKITSMDKWKKIQLLSGMVGMIVALYLSGVLGQLLGRPASIALSPIACLVYAFSSKQGHVGMALVFIVSAAFILFIKIQGSMNADEDPRGFKRSPNGNYGTSGELEYERLRKVLHVTGDMKHEKGIILGTTINGLGKEEIVTIPPDSPYNRNLSVCGSQGSMKSWAFARNMMAQCVAREESFFAMDPKGELYEDMVFALKMHGYKVFQWNLKDMEYSNSWDILREIEDGKYIDVLCDVIIKNTLDGDNPDHFYDNIEKDLLKALLLYAYTQNPYGKRTIGAAYELLLTHTPEELDSMFENLRQTDPENPAIGPYMLFSKAPNSKGSAILGLGTRLQIFQTAIVRRITGTEDIDLTLPAKEKCAVFIIVSDQDSTYNVLATTFINMAFIKCVRYADSRPARRCDVDIHFILDEFPVRS